VADVSLIFLKTEEPISTDPVRRPEPGREPNGDPPHHNPDSAIRAIHYSLDRPKALLITQHGFGRPTDGQTQNSDFAV
jgi:hypothetical protein